MRNLGFGRYALCSCVATAMLAGCGGSQPLIDAPGAMPQTSTIAAPADRGKSWMLPQARNDSLLYISSGGDEVSVATYPQGKLVGTLTGLTNASGLCSDSQGNVFITDGLGQNIVEYAHGGTSPIATLSDSGYWPVDCSFDAVTGNLAVANLQSPGDGAGNIAVYANEQGLPTTYSNPGMANYLSCGYDNKGSLFLVGGTDGSGAFAELPKGSGSFQNFDVTILGLFGVQWDGRYITVGSSPGGRGAKIDRLTVSGSTVTVKGTVPLDRGQHKVNLRYFWIGGGKVLGAFGNYVGFWNYPIGGESTKLLQGGSPWGVTVSGKSISQRSSPT